MNGSITHHPSESLLIAYASGAAPEATALLVATHLSLCAQCRATVREAEVIGGILLENLLPEPVSDDRLQAVLERLDEPTPPRPASQEPQDRTIDPDCIPAPLKSYIHDLRWRRFGPMRHAYLAGKSGQPVARLLSLSPGMTLPEHGHGGEELTLVLTGAFSDNRSRFGRGDVCEVTGDVVHSLKVEPGEQCLGLIVTDSPLRFSGLLPRLMQRFVGL